MSQHDSAQSQIQIVENSLIQLINFKKFKSNVFFDSKNLDILNGLACPTLSAGHDPFDDPSPGRHVTLWQKLRADVYRF